MLIEAINADAREEDGQSQRDVGDEDLAADLSENPCDKTSRDDDKQRSDGDVEISAQSDAGQKNRGDGHKRIAMQRSGRCCGIVLHSCTR